jgi:hypothetical protein
LSKDPNLFAEWALWIVLPWLALHLYNDFSLTRQLKAQRKAGEPPSTGLFGFKRFGEVMRETARRYEQGDPLARAVTYYDLAIAAAFVLYLAYRMYLRWAA